MISVLLKVVLTKRNYVYIILDNTVTFVQTRYVVILYKVLIPTSLSPFSLSIHPLSPSNLFTVVSNFRFVSADGNELLQRYYEPDEMHLSHGRLSTWEQRQSWDEMSTWHSCYNVCVDAISVSRGAFYCLRERCDYCIVAWIIENLQRQANELHVSCTELVLLEETRGWEKTVAYKNILYQLSTVAL